MQRTKPSPLLTRLAQGLGYGEVSSPVRASSVQKRPRVLIMGPKMAGKTSVFKVVFHKMTPHETLFLEPTTQPVKHDVTNSSLFQFQVIDFPGSEDASDQHLQQCASLVYVLDAQDEQSDAIVHKLSQTIARAHKLNPAMHIDVFVHKADGLTADDKDEVFRTISSRLAQDLSDGDTTNYQLHLTSIYDHTLFEAMSRVVQKIIPQLATLEALLDALVAKSRVAKAFLFDVVSKVFIATDSSPLDPQAYELCADMIDVVIDVSCIYGVSEGGEMPQAYDDQSCATIRLNNDHVLYLREVSKYLALVCLMHANSSFKIGLIDHNVAELKQSLVKVFEVPRKR